MFCYNIIFICDVIMRSIHYGEIIKTVTFLKNPKRIVEIGILDGFLYLNSPSQQVTNVLLKHMTFLNHLMENICPYTLTYKRRGILKNQRNDYNIFMHKRQHISSH
jgi:hypothetical protein